MSNLLKKTFTVTLVLMNVVILYGQQCRVPNGGTGMCVPISTCTPILNFSKKPAKTQSDVQFLQQTSCGYGVKSKVCCPPRSQWHTYKPELPIYFPSQVSLPAINEGSNLVLALSSSFDDEFITDDYPRTPPPPPLIGSNCPNGLKAPKYESECCGIDASTGDKIIGGTAASINEYPWLVLLEYADQQVRCGGSLISSRYVLTAAHCVGRTRYGPAVKVYLAEYNTTSYPTDYVESDGGGIDKITNVEVTVERQIRHPQFASKTGSVIHDIALVKLSRNVPFSEYIRPICLPTYDATISSEPEFLLTAAGWGSNTQVTNIIKQKVKLPLYDKEKCRNEYPDALLDSQFCAGGVKGQDTCHGDSGGPLIYEDESIGKAMLVGVVSFGNNMCGTENIPGVYTNVFKYLDWIAKETI